MTGPKMQKMIKYCEKCGIELKKSEEPSGYSPFTGKPLYTMICPKCHTIRDWGRT